jgi:tRNA-5-methyluridine54 2-sulfurtransferase
MKKRKKDTLIKDTLIFEEKIKKTIKKFKLADKKEKIIVACSGGKDSTTILQLLKKLGYNIEALHINLGIGKWSETNLKNTKKICKELNIKLNIIDIKKETGKKISEIEKNQCRFCSINKKYLLNKKARELGGKKIALGHTLDDEAESIIMNFLRGNIELGLGTGPKTGIITDPKFVQRIKPLFFCRNYETKKYAEKMKFDFSTEPCPCSKEVFRRKIRNWLNEMEKENPKIKENIVKFFLNKLPELRKKIKTEKKLQYCEKCREPSRNKICKRCQITESSIMKE